jgi:ADP-heptose:LPS heptosyltransferase
LRRLYSWKAPKPEKTAAVIRYGAFGDLLQTASVLPGLMRQGYHVTFFCTPRGEAAIRHDPHIDRIVIQNEDIVPNHELMDYFNYLKTRYTKVVNMCETVEGVVLPMSGRAHFHWPKEARHLICNRNYVELQHAIAGVPYMRPETRFYETEAERAWGQEERAKASGPVIVWVLTGSAAHKIWPHVDAVVTQLLDSFLEATITFIGGPGEEKLEGDWDHPRVWRRVGQWPIRQVMAFAKIADVVVGPETGVLNAMAMEAMPKVLILSHSTVENLSRDWVNTISLAGEDAHCYPCHQLHLEGWKYCTRHPEGNALCQRLLAPERVYAAIAASLKERERIAA